MNFSNSTTLLCLVLVYTLVLDLRLYVDLKISTDFSFASENVVILYFLHNTSNSIEYCLNLSLSSLFCL